MTTRERILYTTVRAGSFLLGLSLVAVAVWSWRVPGGSVSPGAEVVLRARPLGELAISPLEPVSVGRELRPGARAGSGELSVRNQTGSRLEVRVRATPAGTELDRLLWLEVSSGREPVFHGPLRRLRRWSEQGFHLAPGDTGLLTVRAWLPGDAGSGYEGRSETLEIELLPEPAAVDR
ncbi:MAG TPA: hypothetical protein VEA19_01600 [Actinomycetota bacterium]|nr:hypothetical protein [Actinomycetota bacterium]